MNCDLETKLEGIYDNKKVLRFKRIEAKILYKIELSQFKEIFQLKLFKFLKRFQQKAVEYGQ